MLLYLTLIDNEEQKSRFEEIYNLFHQEMYMYAMAILKNSSNAEDVVHDVFLKVATKHMNTLEKMSTDDDVKYYLLRATKNTALNMINSKHYSNVPIDESLICSNNIPNLSDEEFIDRLCTKSDYTKLINIINELKAPYYEVLYYRFSLDYSTKTIAKLLDRKESTVKKQIARGKKIVVSKIEETRGNHNVNDKS